MEKIKSFVGLCMTNILLYLVISFITLEFDIMKWGLIEKIIVVLGVMYNSKQYLELEK